MSSHVRLEMSSYLSQCLGDFATIYALSCGEKLSPKSTFVEKKWQIWGLLFDPQLSRSTAYKLFLIFNDVSWFMQPFIQCLDTKTLHLPLLLPHGRPPSPWKACKILLNWDVDKLRHHIKSFENNPIVGNAILASRKAELKEQSLTKT